LNISNIFSVVFSILILINIWISLFYSKKILKLLLLKRDDRTAQVTQQDENDIHGLLNSRLLDLQSRRYSVQPKLRGKNE